MTARLVSTAWKVPRDVKNMWEENKERTKGHKESWSTNTQSFRNYTKVSCCRIADFKIVNRDGLNCGVHEQLRMDGVQHHTSLEFEKKSVHWKTVEDEMTVRQKLPQVNQKTP